MVDKKAAHSVARSVVYLVASMAHLKVARWADYLVALKVVL